MRASHHYSRLEVQTYDCAFRNGNLHAFDSAAETAHFNGIQGFKYKRAGGAFDISNKINN